MLRIHQACLNLSSALKMHSVESHRSILSLPATCALLTFWQERCHFHHRHLTGFLWYITDDLWELYGSPGLSLCLSQPRLTDHLLGCMPLLLSQTVKEEQKIGPEREVFDNKREIIGSQCMDVYMCQMEYYCGCVLIKKKKNLFKTRVFIVFVGCFRKSEFITQCAEK